MKVILFKIAEGSCLECWFAVKRFIGRIEGVESVSVDVNPGSFSIRIDETKVEEESIRKLARDSIVRMGFTIEE